MAASATFSTESIIYHRVAMSRTICLFDILHLEARKISRWLTCYLTLFTLLWCLLEEKGMMAWKDGADMFQKL